MALVLVWLGASDVREQFPLWPVVHSHPLAGAPGTENLTLPKGPGLLELACNAGIDPGVFIGTTIPYIATLDLMVTVHRHGVPHLVGISCKPYELIHAADQASNILARLELERLYCEALSISWKVADIKLLGQTLIANLLWCAPDETVASSLRTDLKLEQFLTALTRRIHHEPIDHVVADVACQVGWSTQRGNSAFRYLAWQQWIDIDFSRPVLMTRPAHPGGIVLRRALQDNLLGGIDHE